MVVERAEAGTDDCAGIVERAPGESKARREVILVGLPQAAANVRTRADEQQTARWIDVGLAPARDPQSIGARIETRHLVHPFYKRKVQIVTHAQVEREVRCDFPVILPIHAGGKGHGVVKRLTQIAVGLLGEAEQKVGHRISGEGAIEAEGAAAKGREERVKKEAADVEPGLHRMVTQDERQVLDVVVSIVMAALRKVSGAANS